MKIQKGYKYQLFSEWLYSYRENVLKNTLKIVSKLRMSQMIRKGWGNLIILIKLQ